MAAHREAMEKAKKDTEEFTEKLNNIKDMQKDTTSE
jgi:hypothetical protein